MSLGKRNHKRPWQQYGRRDSDVPSMPDVPLLPPAPQVITIFEWDSKLVRAARDNATRMTKQARERRLAFVAKFGR